jgi:hypothetical protein
MPPVTGIRQTPIASTNVMIEPIKVASQADMRSPASMTSRARTGTSAMIQVVKRFPVGSRI